MAKSSNISDTVQIITNVVILLIALVVLLYALDRYDLYSVGGTHEVINTTQYVPVEEDTCEDYNIPQEYRYAYGNPAIDTLEAGCLGAGGFYTEQYSELSCHWNPDAFLIDCSEDPQIEFRRFCLDELEGVYVCDPSIAYFGCHCNRPIPAEWTPPDEGDGQDQGGDEEIDSNNDGVIETSCTNVVLPQYGDLGGLCRDNGWCPAPALSCEHYFEYNLKEHHCACLDGFFCGQYCYEYFYGTCTCPIGSHSEIVTRSTIQCVPDSRSCFEGNVV